MKNVKTNVAKMRNLFAVALIVMVIIPVYAQQYNNESDFKIDWDDNEKGGAAITKYTGSRTQVRIPPSIQNNPVTNIGIYAFSGCASLTSVTFQGTIASDKLRGNTFVSPFHGDLCKKYLASDGGTGTYIRFAGDSTWKKR